MTFQDEQKINTEQVQFAQKREKNNVVELVRE